MPYARCPKYAEFRYRCRISSLETRFSSSMASRISRSLRAVVCSVASIASFGVLAPSRSAIRTYCMVSVDAPWETPPACWFATKARATPLASTPLCS